MAGLVHLVDRATGTVGDALSRLEHWVVEDCLQGWTPARIPDLSGGCWFAWQGMRRARVLFWWPKVGG